MLVRLETLPPIIPSCCSFLVWGQQPPVIARCCCSRSRRVRQLLVRVVLLHGVSVAQCGGVGCVCRGHPCVMVVARRCAAACHAVVPQVPAPAVLPCEVRQVLVQLRLCLAMGRRAGWGGEVSGSAEERGRGRGAPAEGGPLHLEPPPPPLLLEPTCAAERPPSSTPARWWWWCAWAWACAAACERRGGEGRESPGGGRWEGRKRARVTGRWSQGEPPSPPPHCRGAPAAGSAGARRLRRRRGGGGARGAPRRLPPHRPRRPRRRQPRPA